MTTATESPSPAKIAAQCCASSVAAGPISAAEAERTASLFKALADPVRLRLLSKIASAGCETVCVCSLTDDVGVSQPTVSHHMRKLTEAGIVTRERRGNWAHYSVVPEVFESLRAFLDVR